MTDETLERLVDTYLFYSYPNSIFAFQGGEPTLAGLPFFEKLVGVPAAVRARRPVRQQCAADQRHPDRRALVRAVPRVQLADRRLARRTRRRSTISTASTRRATAPGSKVMQGVETAEEEQGGVQHPLRAQPGERRTSRRSSTSSSARLGIDNMQFIPLAEFDGAGQTAAVHDHAEQYGRFLVRDLRPLVAGAAQGARSATSTTSPKALAGQKPGTCTMHETCDSYVVVEYNGDVYPVRLLRRRATGSWAT